MGLLVLGSFGRDCGGDTAELLLVTGPRLPGRSYKAICSWLLPMVDLDAGGRSHAANQDGCYLFWAWGSSAKQS